MQIYFYDKINLFKRTENVGCYNTTTLILERIQINTTLINTAI